MLKMTSVRDADGKLILKLDGKLLEPWVLELEHTIGKQQNLNQPLMLDLSGLSFVDQAGLRALKRVLAGNAILIAASGFIATLLQGPNHEQVTDGS